MKELVFVMVILIFMGCESKKAPEPTGSETPVETQKELVYSRIPVQAGVSFLSDAIQTNNTIQLIYELNILNNYRLPLNLKKVEIYDLNANNHPIATYDSDYLDKHFQRPGNTDLDDLKLLANNQFGILNLELVFNRDQHIPGRIYHKLYFDGQDKNGEPTAYPIEAAIIKVPDITGITLGLPFNKEGKWLYGAAKNHQGARFIAEGNATYPQRFAVDWLYVDEGGYLAKGDIKQNKNWSSYGLEVIAVADGTIVEIKDGILENEPLSEDMAVKMTRETIGGNHIIIDIGNDLYAFYGHLIPNSLKVKAGDRVEKGQVIGLLGNSGNSDCPHLHFHLESKSNTLYGGEGMPYLIKEFTHLQKYSTEQFEKLFEANRVSFDSLRPAERRNELPIGYGLIDVK